MSLAREWQRDQTNIIKQYAYYLKMRPPHEKICFVNYILRTLVPTALAQTILIGSPDSDGDGYTDDVDSCPNSDLSETVVVAGIDTGVANTLDANGCTINDLLEDVVATGGSQSDVVAAASELKKDGIISGRDFGKIVSASAHM